MATKEQDDHESQAPSKQLGGWITFPFIIGSVFGLAVVFSGSTGNFIVYLIKYFNFKSIDAAQLSNIINACSNLTPLLGAIFSDSFFGCFPVITVSSVASLFSMAMLTLTASIKALRPPNAETPASGGQLALLYVAIALFTVGSGGARFNTMTMGADQFTKVEDQDVFFNWFFIVVYGASAIGSTVVVYVEDSVSWGLGFGICLAVNALSLLSLLLGVKYYRRPGTKGSPFTAMARVAVASFRKRKLALPPPTAASVAAAYYHGPSERADDQLPSSSFRYVFGHQNEL